MSRTREFWVGEWDVIVTNHSCSAVGLEKLAYLGCIDVNMVWSTVFLEWSLEACFSIVDYFSYIIIIVAVWW